MLGAEYATLFPEEIRRNLKKLFELIKALLSLSFIEIPLNKDEDVVDIFESINNRGKKLTLSDIIRFRTIKANTGNPFSTLFRYISGDNQNNEKIEMTTPVYMYQEDGTSAMEFVLPNKYMEKDAPTPSAANVKIYESKPGYYAAVRYGGYSNASKVKIHTDRLMKEIQK